MKKVIVFILVALMAITYCFATNTGSSDTAALAVGASVDATIDFTLSESDIAGYRIGISSDAPGDNWTTSTDLDTGLPQKAISSIALTLAEDGTAKNAGGTYFYWKAKGSTSLKFDVTGAAMTATGGTGAHAPTYLKYTINNVTAKDDKDVTFYKDQVIDLSTDGLDAGELAIDIVTEKLLPIHIGTWQAKLTVTIKTA